MDRSLRLIPCSRKKEEEEEEEKKLTFFPLSLCRFPLSFFFNSPTDGRGGGLLERPRYDPGRAGQARRDGDAQGGEIG